MAILITMADGSEQHFDTIEEFEQALIFTKRLNGEKVPQDLLDEVRDKYGDKDPKTSQVEIDVPQDLEALSKAVEAFFKGIDVTEEDVNMENLPIGTVVKVVDNTTGHCHDLCEILPITDVEYDGKTLYHLDNKIEGWVAVKDIEFVSFPEEEESTSGNGDEDEEEEGSEIKLGDRVRLIDADDPYRVNVSVGTEGTVTGRDFDGDYEVEFNYNYGTMFQTAGIVQIVKVPEYSSEEDSEIKAGDIVIATEDELDITEGVEYEIKESDTGTLYFLDDDGDIRHVSDHEERIRKKIIEAIDEPKFEVGGILRCNKDSMNVSEGKIYEVLAIDRDGDAVYMDDGNSVSYVNETDIPERFEIL